MKVMWTADQRAEELMARRDEFVGRLSRVVAAARQLTREQREFVVDDAIAHVATNYSAPIFSAEETERVFWTAANLRVAQHHQGRYDVVRRGYERVDDSSLADELVDEDPAEIVERAAEHLLAAEFAATLEEREAEFFAVKWQSGSAEPIGYRNVAKRLGIHSKDARKLERMILTKLEAFAAVVSAGALCQARAPDIAGLASGKSVAVARAHLEHCAACKVGYVAALREARSAAFARKVTALLPAPPVATSEHGGRLRDLVADWAGRLLGHDTNAAGHMIASGAARGSGGTIAALIATCLAGGATTIGICAATGVIDLPGIGGDSRPSPQTARPSPTPTPARTATPVPTRTAEPLPTPTPRPRRERSRPAASQAPAQTQGGTSPTSQEESVASDVPAGSAPDGGSEFTPDASSGASAPPAPPPAAPGASEFP